MVLSRSSDNVNAEIYLFSVCVLNTTIGKEPWNDLKLVGMFGLLQLLHIADKEAMSLAIIWQSNREKQPQSAQVKKSVAVERRV